MGKQAEFVVVGEPGEPAGLHGDMLGGLRLGLVTPVSLSGILDFMVTLPRFCPAFYS